MDETGTLLSLPKSAKVVVSKDNKKGSRGARVNRTNVTAIECISADGKYLNPMIIWPAATHRANWTTHSTPGWYFATSEKGSTDSYISLQWLKLIFDPETKEVAGKNPRVLVNDGFGTHETLEVLQFCFENNIILCRLPSHTSHKLQPCDVSVFGPLKTAYRAGVERLDRGGVGAIGKEHFTHIYSPARDKVFTARNIRSGWSGAGLFPFNPSKVLEEIPKPDPEVPNACNSAIQPNPCVHNDEVPPTPATPVTAESLSSLLDLMKRIPHDEANRAFHQKLQQKHINATQLCFAERALLQTQNQFLTEINNEGKVRRSTKSKVLGKGKARIMLWDDLDAARAALAAKEKEKEEKKARRAAKPAEQEVKSAEKEAKAAEKKKQRLRRGKRKLQRKKCRPLRKKRRRSRKQWKNLPVKVQEDGSAKQAQQ